MKRKSILVLFLLINLICTAQTKRSKVIKPKPKVVNPKLDYAVNKTLMILKEKGIIVKY